MELKKRRILFIMPQFQVKFITWVMVLMVVLLIGLYCSQLYFFKVYFSMAESLNLQKNHAFYLFLKKQFELMNTIYLIAFLSSVLGSVLFGLYFSIRVAGPIYRLIQFLSDESNDQKSIHFRRDDFFQELAVAFNQYLGRKK